MTNRPYLRPLERRVLALRAAGVSIDEIGRRFDRSPAHIERVIQWSDIPRTAHQTGRLAHAVEQRVLHLRSRGESHEQIGERFRRSGRFIRQVEGLAHYRRGLALLGESQV